MLGPQRDKASELSKQIDDLHASISREQQVADFAEQARREFPRYYGRLVVLGQGRAGTGRYRLDARAAQLDFESLAGGFPGDLVEPGLGFGRYRHVFELQPDHDPTDQQHRAHGSHCPGSDRDQRRRAQHDGERNLRVGRTGLRHARAGDRGVRGDPADRRRRRPGGLPTLPYDLTFRGTFFDISNFIGGIDGLVTPQDGGTQVSSDGRLFTVNGFALNGGAPGSSPKLDANFLVTTYVTPEEQGLTAGATPSGPAAPSAPGTPQAQPASAVVSK